MAFTVMIVEDDASLRRLFQFLLTESGYTVIDAEDGQAALEQFAIRPCDVVVTDLNMPRLNGMDLVAALRDRYPDTHIIMITAFGTPTTRKQALAAGVDEYITKPFDFEDLEYRVRSFYERRILRTVERNASTAALESFYEQLQACAAQPDMALLAVSARANLTEAQTLFKDGAIVLDHSEMDIRLGITDIAALVPTDVVEPCIEDMLGSFYDHPLAKRRPEVVLTYGWAHGPHPSANALIEAVAHDLAERRQSQGIASTREPAILGLEPGRTRLLQRFEAASYRCELYREELRARRHIDERTLRAEIEQLTAVVLHDLNSGFNTLHEAINQIAVHTLDPSPQVQAALPVVRRAVVLCTAWQYTIAEIGTGNVRRSQELSLANWFTEHVGMLRDQIDPALEITIDIPPNLRAGLDPHMLLVAGLHMLLACQFAGARYLRITAGTVERDGGFALSFVDDGQHIDRMQALQPDMPLSEQVNLPRALQGVALLPRLLQQHNITPSCTEGDGVFRLRWKIPGSHWDTQELVKSFVDLDREVRGVEQEMSYLEQQLALPSDLFTESVPTQAKELLVPYVQELENHLQLLLNWALALKNLNGVDPTVSQKISNLSLYCYLLVRNLTLALRGNALPIERVDVNAEIRQVLSLLEHKLAHLHQVDRQLTKELPPILLASVEAKQILMNVIKNAAEATRPDGMLTISTDCHQDRVIIRVRDTGVGIPLENREDIFHLNFSTKGRGLNSGVGLHAVKSLVSRAGGCIRLASATLDAQGNLETWHTDFKDDSWHWTDPGTVFHIEFPVAKVR